MDAKIRGKATENRKKEDEAFTTLSKSKPNIITIISGVEQHHENYISASPTPTLSPKSALDPDIININNMRRSDGDINGILINVP